MALKIFDPNEKPDVVLKLDETIKPGYVTILANNHPILHINQETGRYVRPACVPKELGFELDSEGKIILH